MDKKIVIVALSFLVMFALIATVVLPMIFVKSYSRTAPPEGYGDLDGDGYVSSPPDYRPGNDVFIIVAFYDQYGPWDVNCDGKTDNNDIYAIGNDFDKTGLPYWIRADVTCDGVVDICDVTLVTYYIGQSSTPPLSQERINQINSSIPFNSSELIYRGDVDGNGMLDYNDSILIHKYAIGDIDKFPVQEEINKPPMAVLDKESYEVNSGEYITFDGSASYDPDGTYIEYRWVFSTGAYPEYEDTGWTSDAVVSRSWTCTSTHYGTVTLSVKDSDGAISSTSASITIVGPSGYVDLVGGVRQGDGYITIDGVKYSSSWGIYDTYSIGDMVTFNAFPAENNEFKWWQVTVDGNSEVIYNNPILVTLSDSRVEVDVAFGGKTCYLTKSIIGLGDIRVDPYYKPEGYEYGTQLTLTAIPNTGWAFDHWSGDTSGSENPTTITMNGDKNVIAYFVKIQPDQFTLTLASDPPEGGTITAIPSGGTYDAGTVVTLTAVPNNGYAFKGWTGIGITDTTSLTTTVTMNSDMTVTAHFEKTRVHLPWLFPMILVLIAGGIGMLVYNERKK